MKTSSTVLLIGLVLCAFGWSGSVAQSAAQPIKFDGDARRGAVVITAAGCGQCHQIPGISNAVGVVGPPLAGFGRRTTVAGLLPNKTDELAKWLRYPQKVLPGNAMPDMGLSARDARDAVAYLQTLK